MYCLYSVSVNIYAPTLKTHTYTRGAHHHALVQPVQRGAAVTVASSRWSEKNILQSIIQFLDPPTPTASSVPSSLIMYQDNSKPAPPPSHIISHMEGHTVISTSSTAQSASHSHTHTDRWNSISSQQTAFSRAFAVPRLLREWKFHGVKSLPLVSIRHVMMFVTYDRLLKPPFI